MCPCMYIYSTCSSGKRHHDLTMIRASTSIMAYPYAVRMVTTHERQGTLHAWDSFTSIPTVNALPPPAYACSIASSSIASRVYRGNAKRKTEDCGSD